MVIETERLIVRAPVEDDRNRFVELFTSEQFMIFSGVLDVESANARFDHMLAMSQLVPFAKQPIIERTTSTIIGYTGADSIGFDGVDRLEWGWRLVEEGRGRGLATEAVAALLAVADETVDGELLCLLDPKNEASRRVADKVGFTWSHRRDWMGDPSLPTDVMTRPIGSGGPTLLAPRPREP